jgi:hypothetical protein
LFGLDPESKILIEDLHPICLACDDFRKAFDINFIKLCEATRMFEWYRSSSKKQGEYFPTEFVYNISLSKLKSMYTIMLAIADEAWKLSMNDEVRKDREEEFNYEWRKKDE